MIDKISLTGGALLPKQSGILYAEPKKLLSANRLDLIVKVIFARKILNSELRFSDEFVSMLYRKHIFLRTRGIEPNSSKTSIIDYERYFLDVVRSINTNGLSASDPILLSEDGGVLNGAHRLAAAIACEHPLVPYRVDYVSKSRTWDWIWFSDNCFGDDELSAIAETWLDIKKSESAIYIYWPTLRHKYEQIICDLTFSGSLVFQKEFNLGSGFDEFVYDIYSHQHGPKISFEQSHIREKINVLKRYGTSVLVVLAVMPSEAGSRVLDKDKSRTALHIPGLDVYNTLHAADSCDELDHIAKIVLNSQGMHNYISAKPVSRTLADNLSKLLSVCHELGIDDRYVIVGGSVLDLHGIKSSHDIDIILDPDARRKLNISAAVSVSEDVDVVNENYWRQVPDLLKPQLTDMSTVHRVDLHTWRRGFKFLDLKWVLKKKVFSRRSKDLEDLKRLSKNCQTVFSSESLSVKSSGITDLVDEKIGNLSDLISVAESCHLAGDLVGASYVYRKVVEVEPSHLAGNYGVSLCAYHRGDFRVCREYLLRCIHIEPGHRLAVDFLNYLNSEYFKEEFKTDD